MSIVIPFYNEEEMFPFLRVEVTDFLDSSPFAFEVIAINDGSSDRTTDLFVDWSEADSRIKVLNLSAISDTSTPQRLESIMPRDAIVLIDADLQIPLK